MIRVSLPNVRSIVSTEELISPVCVHDCSCSDDESEKQPAGPLERYRDEGAEQRKYSVLGRSGMRCSSAELGDLLENWVRLKLGLLHLCCSQQAARFTQMINSPNALSYTTLHAQSFDLSVCAAALLGGCHGMGLGLGRARIGSLYSTCSGCRGCQLLGHPPA